MCFKNAEEYYTSKSFIVGRKLMQYEDVKKQIDGMKQFDERIYEQTECELKETLAKLTKELNIQLLVYTLR
tara:strand:- start:115 stop:327 length:213 start_codon:yes stop_codon:yes gene_type:complete